MRHRKRRTLTVTQDDLPKDKGADAAPVAVAA